MGKTVWKSSDGDWLGKSTKLGMLVGSKKTKVILIEAEFSSYMKKLMKNVNKVEPTSFLEHVYLGCTQRECKPNEKIIGQYNKMFDSRISAGATEKLPGWDKPGAKTSAWSYDMEGHARKCV